MKKAIASLTAVALAASLAACGGTTATSSSTASSTEASSATTAASSQAGDAAAKLSGKVVYWSMWTETEPQAEILKSAIDAFEAANPDCTVEVEWTGRGVKDLISAAIASGQ